MQRFRRAISFRRSQRHIPESCRPHQWESDSHKVKSGGISFAVKYLGAQEVTESRGTQICSEAAKILKKNKRRRRSRKMTLLVTEDCIRVVDDKTKQLVIDQTIEKVSFCTPDPYNEKLFCYISRDGTSRRWMCQCFSARRDTGERLSHAVGCAFTACLQRKQKQVALKEQHFERQASMRGPTNKEKIAGEIGTVLAGSQLDTVSAKPPGSTSADLSTQPSSPSVSSDQGSPPASLSSSPTHIPVPAPLEETENQPIRKKEKKLNLQSRPRPQGVNANPFTRHTSLRYRSQPLSLQPLKPGKYEILTDDQAVLPRLPPSPPETTPQPNKPTDIDALLSMQDPATNTWNNTNTGTAQGTTGNQWQVSGVNSTGALTANQNSQAAGPQSNSWSNDLKIQPANKQANPFQVNGDDFGNLATRHQNTEAKGNNPFKTQEPVRWL